MKGQIFFIVGVQRSGTTLLSSLLDKHPDIDMEPTSIGFRIVTCFNNFYDLLPHNLEHSRKEVMAWIIENDDKGRLAKIIDYEHLEEYATIRDLIEQSIAKKLATNGQLVWGDKSPNLQHFAKDLMLLIPEAKFLHIVRDGRANAYSMSSRSYKNLRLSAQEWVDGNVYGMLNQEILGTERYKILKYEDLLQEPEKELRGVCNFLEIEFVAEMMDLSDDTLPEEKKYVKSFFDRSKIDKWKKQLSTAEIEKIEGIQGPLLKQLDYPLAAKKTLKYQQLPLWQRIGYNQVDNLKQLFRGKQIGMKDKEKVVLKFSLKNRVYSFLTVWIRDFVHMRIFKSWFSRYFYKEKFFKKKK